MSDDQQGGAGLGPGASREGTTLVQPRAPAPLAPGEGSSSAQPTLERSEHEPTSWVLPLGSTLAGRYTVLSMLGQGGMGVVVAAYDSRLDRRVALKLLPSRPGAGSHEQALQARLVREAQAMARLSHPHVVQVYDAGTLEDGAIFIAMELVEGQTLRQWSQQQPRSWREVRRAYLQAGRGLEAAHAAGLVHRDFKPENVLVGKDERVRVTDFGVARAVPPQPLDTPLPQSPLTPRALPTQEWEAPLTLPGMVLGTLKYMAPELLQGQPASVRSDVFAYCVALYEALYGQPAFAGSSSAERAQAQREGRLRPPPPQSQVPVWVGHAVLQGLLADPLQRPGSMSELLAALEEDPEARRRARLRQAALAGGVALLAGLAVWGWLRQQGPACGHMERRLAGVWDEAVREQVEGALVSTGVVYAQDTAARLSSVLDGYARQWVVMRTEACEAARQQAGQPRSLAVLQEYCLERRRSRLRALTQLLGHRTDKALVPKVVQAALTLPPLEYCADERALTAAVPPPEEPAVRERAEALQEQVDALEALNTAGKYQEGLALGEQLLRQVEPVGHAPLHARALYIHAQLQDGAGDYQGSESSLRHAIALAAAGKDTVLVAQASSLLAWSIGGRQARYTEALSQEPLLEAVVSLADDDMTRALSLAMLGNVLVQFGRYDEARGRFERALALYEKAHVSEHFNMARTVSNLGTAHMRMGKYEEAKALFERSLAMFEKMLGPEHPYVAGLTYNLGNLLKKMGRFKQALACHERALALREKILGPEHPHTADSLASLGNVFLELGRYEEARALHERALALRQRTLGPEHPQTALALIHLGMTLDEQGRHEEAGERYRRSLAIQEKALGPEHPELAYAHMGLGYVMLHLRRWDQAELHLQRVRAVQEKALGREHPEVADALLLQGELLLARGRPAEAVAILERALAVTSANMRPSVQLALAQALWEARQARPRALELATQAREHWQQVGHQPNLARLSSWLATHTLP